MSSFSDFMGYQPPTFSTVAPNSGGGRNALASALPSVLTGPGGIAASLFGGGLLSGGLSPSSSSDAQGAPVASTGWGTFNSPFIIGTGGSKIDSRNDGQLPTSLDFAQTGPTGGARAPLLSGDNSGFMTVAAIGLVGLVLVKALARKKG